MELLDSIFTDECMAAWFRSEKPTDSAILRCQILGAQGGTSNDLKLRESNLFLRAYKAAWETYLHAASVIGMLGEERGIELIGRLRSKDDRDFRSALAECMTAWVFAGKMGLRTDPFAPGRGKKQLDLKVHTHEQDIGVEVKAPYRRTPRGMWCGDDADRIRGCLIEAQDQFDKTGPNILVIVPSLRTSMISNRRDLVKAVFGEEIITFLVNTETGEGGPPELDFRRNGAFLKPIKSGGLPAYQRISALACIEEVQVTKFPNPMDNFLRIYFSSGRPPGEFWSWFWRARDRFYSVENEGWIDHRIVVLHNPNAYHPISEKMWDLFPQLVRRDNGMVWTDGTDDGGE